MTPRSEFQLVRGGPQKAGFPCESLHGSWILAAAVFITERSSEHLERLRSLGGLLLPRWEEAGRASQGSFKGRGTTAKRHLTRPLAKVRGCLKSRVEKAFPRLDHEVGQWVVERPDPCRTLAIPPRLGSSRSSELITKTTQPKEGLDSSPQHSAHRTHPLCSSTPSIRRWPIGGVLAMLTSLDSLRLLPLSHHASTRGVLQSGIPRNTAALFRTLQAFCNHSSAAGSGSRGHGAATTLGPSGTPDTLRHFAMASWKRPRNKRR